MKNMLLLVLGVWVCTPLFGMREINLLDNKISTIDPPLASKQSLYSNGSDVSGLLTTNYYLLPGKSSLRFQIGFGSNLKIDREEYSMNMPPVSIVYEYALKSNFTAFLGLGGHIFSQNESTVKYQYYNLFVGSNYHFNIESLTGIDGLLPYVGLSTSFRFAHLKDIESDYSNSKSKISLDSVIGCRYNLNKLGFLLEFGSIDTSCFRLGIFFML